MRRADAALGPPKVPDVLSQVRHCLDYLGYTTTSAALRQEAKDKKIDLRPWKDREFPQDAPVSLMDFWVDAGLNRGYPAPVLSHDNTRNVESEAEGGALVNNEDEDSSASSSDDDSVSSSSSDSSAKPGEKRKRVLTPSSSEDESSDSASNAESDAKMADGASLSDSSSDSDSSEDEDRPLKRKKLSDSDKGSVGGKATNKPALNRVSYSSDSDSPLSKSKKPVSNNKKSGITVPPKEDSKADASSESSSGKL